jgi:hypothetical protein
VPVARLLKTGAGADDFRWQIDLVGDKNGSNVIFLLPEKFDQDTIRVYRNGQRLMVGAGDDFTISESGGAGTGFDTITLLDRPPRSDENLFADYVVSP